MMGYKTILLIEDNELNIKLTKHLLEMGGYNVLLALDAETGLRMAREHLPDLILMDIDLPGMNGLDAARVIKNDPELREIPVMALTSYAMKGDDEKAREAGCEGYITKPIDTRNFLKTISRSFQNPTPIMKTKR